MISYNRAKRVLERERWRIRCQELDTQFVRGILHGLTLALALIQEVWMKTKDQPHNNLMGKRKAA